MTLIVYATILAFCFTALIGLSLLNFFIGLILSLAILGILPRVPRTSALQLPDMETNDQLWTFLWRLLYVTVDFVWDLTKSNVDIAIDVWTFWSDKYRPAVVYVPVDDLSDLQIMFLASRITLTPGTLSCDLTGDKRFLIVHVMYMQGRRRADVAAQLRQPVDILKREL